MESLDFKSVARKNSQSGFSLVEALIALAMLSVAATLISQYSTFFVSRDRGYKRACEAYAQSIVNVVQEETYYREVLHFLQTNTAQVPAFLNGPSIAVPNVATHWTGAPAADFNLAVAGTAATGVTLRNYHLINGSIRALTTIYNTTPAVRGVFGIYPPLTANAAVLPVPPLFARLGVNVRMRIQPYLIATQAASAPATPVFIRPTSRTNVNDVSAFAAGSGNLAIPAINNEGPTLLVPVPDRIANPGTAIDTTGLELTIQVTYREPGDPADSTCVATQKFEYPRDGTPPAPPTVQVLAGMNSTWPRANCIDTPNRTVQVNITAAAADAERGVQYLCRDLSWQQVWNTYSGPIYGAQVCIRGGAVLGPAQILPYSPNPLLRNATDRETRWVPCHQLRQCGFPPITNAASFNPAPNISRASSNQTLNMTYGQAGSPLPFGCVLNFEVVAVDSAGNSSVAATPANRRFLEVAPAGVEPQNEVHYATCGASCRFGVSYWYHHFAYIFPLNRFPNGYYTCRPGGCCIGVGCTPFN